MAGYRKGKGNVDIPFAVSTMLRANVMGYVVTIIFILLGSIILTYTNATAGIEKFIILVGVILSAFLVGFDTATVEKRNGYKWGALGGFVYFVIFTIVGTILKEGKAIDMTELLTVAIAVLISSSIAGMISVNSQK